MKQFFSLAITLCVTQLHAADPNTFEDHCALTAANLQNVAEHRIEQCQRASDNTPLHEAILQSNVKAVAKIITYFSDGPPGLAENPLLAQNDANINPVFLVYLKAVVSETPAEANAAVGMMRAILRCPQKSTYDHIQFTPGVIVELPPGVEVDNSIQISFGNFDD